MANRTSGSLTTFFPPLRRWFRQFVVGNSGAIIIAVGLIVGINFQRIIVVASFALYSLSSNRAEAAEEKPRDGQIENAVMENERARQVLVSRREAIRNSWEAFLAANRGPFNENNVIRYDDCLRRRSIASTDKLAEDKIFAELADEFIIWLNKAKTLDKSNWTYSDLKDRTFGTIYLSQFFKGASHCLTPQDLWRANRFEKPID